MAEQVGPATTEGAVSGRPGAGGDAGNGTAEPVPFVSQVPGTPVHFPHFAGRPVSWVMVSGILAGFLAGGLALVFGIWWLFWVSVAVACVSGLAALGTGIVDDWY